jgi:hypothetical protein
VRGLGVARTLLATAGIGAIPGPVNPVYRTDGLGCAARHSGIPRYVRTDRNFPMTANSNAFTYTRISFSEDSMTTNTTNTRA